jgi:hypothetical protein
MYRIIITLILAVATNSPPAVSQMLNVEKKSGHSQKSDHALVPTALEPRYIVDPDGRRIRLVGPRFLPDPEKKLLFPGRKVPDASGVAAEAP